MSIEFETEAREKFKQYDSFQVEAREKFKQYDAFQVEVREKFRQYDAFQVEVREKLDILTNTVNEHSKILNDIHRVVLLMENQLNDKVSILFDSYSLNNDEHQIFETRFYDLENLALKNSTKISALEDLTALHSKQLAKFNS